MSTILILFVCVIAVVVIVVSKSKNGNATIIGEENNDTPILKDEVISENVNVEGNIIMVIDDVFSLTGRGTAVTGKIVNGTIKWAYLGDLLNININVEVKEVDFKKEFDNYAKDILACDVQFQPFTHLYNCAKYFYELGIMASNKSQKRE